MKNEFIQTSNISKFNDICAELEDPQSLIGPSLAMVTGPAGRGKSEAAKQYASRGTAIYLPPLNIRSAPMLLREITFELCKVRPGRSETCLRIIGDEMSKDRRLIIVDEADLLHMQILEMLRNLNERYSCPVLLIGEDGMKNRIDSRTRLKSRIRMRMEFSPLTQPDIVLFLRKALDIKPAPEVVTALHKHSNGDWRPVLTATIAIARAMRASGLTEVSIDLVKDIVGVHK